MLVLSLNGFKDTFVSGIVVRRRALWTEVTLLSFKMSFQQEDLCGYVKLATRPILLVSIS